MLIELRKGMTLHPCTFNAVIAPEKVIISALNNNTHLQRFLFLYISGNYSRRLSLINRSSKNFEVRRAFTAHQLFTILKEVSHTVLLIEHDPTLFDGSTLSDDESVNYAQKKHYFWFGDVGMAGILAGSIAIPAGIWFAGQTEISLAFIAGAVLFLPLFVFIPKLIQRPMKADTDAAIDAFGKNEQVKKVFWTLFVAMAGLVLARVVDPVTVQQVMEIITVMGGKQEKERCIISFPTHIGFF